MRYVIALLLLLLVSPVAHAAEALGENVAEQPRVLEPRLAEGPIGHPGLLLGPVALSEQRNTTSGLVSSQDMPRRGGMLWVIGALVVAGIILAAVLV